jgi:hypothetical protein
MQAGHIQPSGSERHRPVSASISSLLGNVRNDRPGPLRRQTRQTTHSELMVRDATDHGSRRGLRTGADRLHSYGPVGATAVAILRNPPSQAPRTTAATVRRCSVLGGRGARGGSLNRHRHRNGSNPPPSGHCFTSGTRSGTTPEGTPGARRRPPRIDAQNRRPFSVRLIQRRPASGCPRSRRRPPSRTAPSQHSVGNVAQVDRFVALASRWRP